MGAGGMGEVYNARDTRLNRVVAIKVAKTEFSERFEREARAVATLNHPNICTLHDVGPNYLVMEYVEGDTLSKVIEQGPLPPDKVLRYALQVAYALAAAHAKGIIHRDSRWPGMSSCRSSFGCKSRSQQCTAQTASWIRDLRHET